MMDKAVAEKKIEREAEETFVLDDTDRKIVEITQSGLPLVSRPYDDIAQR